MDILGRKPNLLFLIFVRNQSIVFLSFGLNTTIFRRKLVKALTVYNYFNGEHTWKINNLLHRENGPAFIDDNKKRHAWCINGKLTAYVGSNGYKSWFDNGKRHRDDGPAVIHPNGTEYYYQNGKQL